MYDFFLNSIKKYVPLPEDQASLVISKMQFRKVRKKQWLITPGDYCKAEYFVNKGCFRAYYVDDQGHEHIIKFATEGWWITDIESLYHNIPANTYIEALEDGEVIIFPRETMEELLDSIPQLNKYFRLVYQKGLANTSSRILRTISQTAAEHYRIFLEQYPGIEQRVPQYMIAAYLGVTPEFFSKVKTRLLRG